MAATNTQIDLTQLIAVTTKAHGAMASAIEIIKTRDAAIIAALKADNDFDNANIANVQTAMNTSTAELATKTAELDAAILAGSGGGTPTP